MAVEGHLRRADDGRGHRDWVGPREATANERSCALPSITPETMTDWLPHRTFRSSAPAKRQQRPSSLKADHYQSPRRRRSMVKIASQFDFEHRRINLNPPGRRQTKKVRPIVPMAKFLSNALKGCRRKYAIEYHGDRIGSVKSAWRLLRRAARVPDQRHGRSSAAKRIASRSHPGAL